MGIERYDTVIIGGGSAGCILANRLSEAPDHRVLVLEAGRPDAWWDLFIHMPAGLTTPLGNRFYDWRYQSEPEPEMGGRRVYHARGKVLGGSSSINGMIYVRGNALDFERWAADPGMARWSYAHCLPYFKRAETRVDGDARYRGDRGPLKLEVGPCTNPLFQAFFAAAQQAGYPLTDDYNGYRQEGFGPFDRNVSGGRRLSAARAYLHPVMRRRNLTVRCRAMVTGLVMDGDRIVGVDYRRWGRSRRVEAGQVICCGGSINTPQLLQLSGIGDPETLAAAGVELRHALPGVGGNLQDHLEVYVQHTCKQPVSYVPALKRRNQPWIGLQWLLAKTGPAATNHFEAGGFYRSNDDVEWPDVQLHFLPLAVRYDGTVPAGQHGYQIHAGPNLPDACGRLSIRSADPFERPSLVFNYLSTERDRRDWVRVIRTVREILRQPAFEEFDGGEISPGPAVQSDEEILDWVARDAETALHPCGTCRMGIGDDAVVDPDTLEVHGLQGLRVVDASVIPYVPNGNIYAPVVMIAEKAADLIRGDTPLPPSEAPFYRHRPPATDR